MEPFGELKRELALELPNPIEMNLPIDDSLFEVGKKCKILI